MFKSAALAWVAAVSVAASPMSPDAQADPAQNLSPSNGSSIERVSGSTEGVEVTFTCAPYAPGQLASQRQYVKFATKPELGPDGQLAAAFTVHIDYGVTPIDAAETQCRAHLPAMGFGTYYWQVVRIESSFVPGPVWSFNVTSSRPKRPTAYIACGTGRRARPARSCSRSRIGAFFKSPSDTTYKLCVLFPTRKQLCSRLQVATAGVLYVNPITTKIPGRHRVTWYVEGRRIVRYFRRMR